MGDSNLSSQDDLVGVGFPSQEEMDFFYKFAEIGEGSDLVRTTSETLVMKPSRLKLRNLEHLPATTTLDVHVGNLFDIFIRSMIQKAGGSLVDTRYWLDYKHPQYFDMTGISIRPKTYAMVDGHTLIDKIIRCHPPTRLYETMKISMKIFKKA